MSRYRRIGVFDSGLGGLTVVRHLLPYAAGAEVVYLGDTARVPYGSRSPDTIRRYAAELVRFLRSYGVDALVVACNTMSAVALESIRQCAEGVPLFDVLSPTVAQALRWTAGRIGVIGTRATIASGIYERLLRKEADTPLSIYSQPCPLFVPLVEEGWSEHPVAEQVAEEYLAPLRAAGVDTLILGCTHYPLLLPVLQRVMPNCRFVDSGQALAERFGHLQEIDPEGPPPSLRLLLTDTAGPTVEYILRRLELTPAEVRQVSVHGDD